MKERILLLSLLLCLSSLCQGQSDHLHRSLLVLCMQEEFTCNEQYVPGKLSDPILLNINLLAEHMKAQKIPIVYTQQEGEQPYERTGVTVPDLDLNLVVYGGRRFIQQTDNALANQLLLDDLLERDLRVLYVAGLHTDKQVYATVRAALRHKFTVYLITDAVACKDEKTQRKFLRKLARKRSIHLISTEELLAREF